MNAGAALAWLLEDPTRWGNFAEAWLVLFGGSDLVEMVTGAWWEPLWLFFWKAACVIGLAASYGAWRQNDLP